MRLSPVLLSLLTLAAVGCVSPSDPLARGDALEEARKHYTALVRWGQLERASHFVAPAQRAAYQTLAEDFTSIRITDSEASEPNFEGSDEAEVQVTYRAYSLATLVEGRFQERQTWYREPGFKSKWLVRTDLAEALQRLAAGRS